jgi:DNA-binding MarR family transcriptional regulator
MRMRVAKSLGFSREVIIPSILLRALAKVKLSPNETRIVFFLLEARFRKDPGDGLGAIREVPLSIIAKDLCMDRRHVDRAIDGLSSRGMILKKPHPTRKHFMVVELQQNFGQWKTSK